MSPPNSSRNVVFISKATPEDDEFVLWLAPRLEAAGYEVFADILSLDPGDRWRKEVTKTLQEKAVKMLLCCQDSTLSKDGVQEEIGMASDLSKELGDPRFIIPVRLKKYKRVFGIGELQYINFSGQWAQGLVDLLDLLERQNVPRREGEPRIRREWSNYKKRLAITIHQSPEPLTSNWVRVYDTPESIRYFVPNGALDQDGLSQACQNSTSPSQLHQHGFFSFCNQVEIDSEFSGIGKFKLHQEINLNEFLEVGFEGLSVKPREAKNFISSMFRQSWENACRKKELLEYAYSNQVGFHITSKQIGLGKKIRWGSTEKKRFATLRNIKGGKVWQYGVSASPEFWPFMHFRLKARVTFSPLENGEAGDPFDDPAKQHKLRRGNCSGWRNKAWHSRLMGYLKLLANDGDKIHLPLSDSVFLNLEPEPIQLKSLVSTDLPDVLLDDDEEKDPSTLGNHSFDEDE